MDKVLLVAKWLLANWETVLNLTLALLGSAFALALVIPGDHPDKELQAAVNFLNRFSRKPSQSQNPEQK